jgi:hypothetical protein
MSAVTPFILERTAANTRAAARAAQEQVELLRRQNQLLEQILGKLPEATAEPKEKTEPKEKK